MKPARAGNARSTLGCKIARIRTRERAIEIARRDPPVGLSGREAIAAIEEVLDVIRVQSACRIS
jgi:hypothetical protein